MNGEKKLTTITKPFKGKGKCGTAKGRLVASQKANV
jgi:hypothetical protein